jgi:hypothetical protein
MACAVDGVSEDVAIDDMIALESEDATSEVEETKLKLAKTNPVLKCCSRVDRGRAALRENALLVLVHGLGYL